MHQCYQGTLWSKERRSLGGVGWAVFVSHGAKGRLFLNRRVRLSGWEVRSEKHWSFMLKWEPELCTMSLLPVLDWQSWTFTAVLKRLHVLEALVVLAVTIIREVGKVIFFSRVLLDFSGSKDWSDSRCFLACVCVCAAALLRSMQPAGNVITEMYLKKTNSKNAACY